MVLRVVSGGIRHMVVVVSGGPSCGLGWHSLVSGGVLWFRTLVVRWLFMFLSLGVRWLLFAARCSLLVGGCSVMVVH